MSSVQRFAGKSESHSGSGTEIERTASVTEQLIAVGEAFYSRNWVLGTAGNFSAVVSHDPFQLAITASGAHKGALTKADFLQVDQVGRSHEPHRQPSAETSIHLVLIAECGAGVVLHTHSVWSTILSDLYAASGSLTLEGFEMLKGLSRVKTHQHCEQLPIVENSQDYGPLSRAVVQALKAYPGCHGVLLRKHGLYTWGKNIEEATRHVEIFEFLFEVIGRQLHIFSQMEQRETSGNRICS